jgi:RNA polymerase sigma factor (sigma-70 family)
MADQNAEFVSLVKRALAGDNEAACELHTSYGSYILYTVRRNLHKRLRPKFDSLDFVQDVWASFFAEFPDKHAFAGPDDLIAFLKTLARNKVLDGTRGRLRGQKHNVGREVSLEAIPEEGESLPAAQSTPSQVLMGEEEWIQFLDKQPLVHRRIFLLLREGKSSATIAEELSISQRSVNRILRKIFHGKPA